MTAASSTLPRIAMSPLAQAALVGPWLIRMGLLHSLAYRMSSVVNGLDFPLILTVYYFLFTALYASLPAGSTEVGGANLGHTLTYIALVWFIDGMTKTFVEWDMAEEIREGKIAVLLARPVDLMTYYFCKCVGLMSFRVGAVLVPFFLLALLLIDFQGPGPNANLPAFGLGLVGAFLLSYCMAYALGLCGFFMEYNSGVIIIKDALIRALGGLVIPLMLLPEALQAGLLKTPFPYLFYAPVQQYLGTLPVAELNRLVLGQWLWVLVFFGLCRIVQALAYRRVFIQGG